MTIRFDDVKEDAQGLPVVSWTEDRNIFAPDGLGPARVACFVRPGEGGELMFVAAGSVRYGAFEEARPWRLLKSFESSQAEQHYYSPERFAVMKVLREKNKMLAIAMTDGAHILLASFADERASVPMHLNCASATPVEIAELHDRLRREFIDKRKEYVLKSYYRDYVWKGRKKFKAYVLPKPVELPWADWGVHACVAAIFAVFALAFWWFVAP